MTKDGDHAITVTYSNTSGSVAAKDGEYISKVYLDGLTLKGEVTTLPTLSATSSGSGSFVTGITASGHKINFTKGNLDGSLPDGGGKNIPIYISNGSP